MGKIISFFPTLTDELIDLLSISCEYNFFYFPNSATSKLEEIKSTIANDKFITLSTKENHYDPFTFDLYLRTNLSIKNCSILYGENGIAPTNSKIGIGMEWYSNKAK